MTTFLERGFVKRKRIRPNFEHFAKESQAYPVPPALEAANFSDPNFRHLRLGSCCGLGPNNTVLAVSQTRFFIRPEIRRLWNVLDNANNLTVSVVGSPGTGKSIAILRFAFNRDAVNTPHRFLYVQGMNGLIFLLWFRMKTQRYEWVSITDPNFSDSCSFLSHLLKENTNNTGVLVFDTLIVDGFDSVIHKQVHNIIVDYPNIKFIRCISWDQRNHADADSSRLIIDHVFGGWSEKDYQAAFVEGCFPFIDISEGQNLISVVRTRFYYAGSNARIFTIPGQNWEDIAIHLIDKAFNALGSIVGLHIHSAHQGSLYNVDCDLNVSICSEYIAKRLSSRASLALVDGARGYLPNNPSYQEWVTKLEALHLIQSSIVFHLWNATGNSRLWERHVTRPVWFVDHLDNKIAPENLTAPQFYFPQKWNYDTYDGLHLEDVHTANFFKVTDVLSHSFNGKHLYDYAVAFGVHRLHFYYILKSRAKIEQFVLPTVSSGVHAGIIVRLEVNKRSKLNKAIYEALMENISRGILAASVAALLPSELSNLTNAMAVASLAAARSLAGTYTAAARQAALPGVQSTLLAAVTGAFQVALALPVLPTAQTTALQVAVEIAIQIGVKIEQGLGASKFDFSVVSYRDG